MLGARIKIFLCLTLFVHYKCNMSKIDIKLTYNINNKFNNIINQNKNFFKGLSFHLGERLFFDLSRKNIKIKTCKICNKTYILLHGKLSKSDICCSCTSKKNAINKARLNIQKRICEMGDKLSVFNEKYYIFLLKEFEKYPMYEELFNKYYLNIAYILYKIGLLDKIDYKRGSKISWAYLRKAIKQKYNNKEVNFSSLSNNILRKNGLDNYMEEE